MDEMQQQYAAPEQNPERALCEKQPKEKKKKSFGAGVATGIVICLFVCMIAGIIIAVNTGRKTGGVLNAAELEKLVLLNSMLDEKYYKEIKDEDKVEYIYKGLVESAEDPYTEYMTKKEYEDYKIDSDGNYAGIGAVLAKDKETNEVTIIRVFDDSPAMKAGLKEYDVILSADGTYGKNMDIDEFVTYVRGTEGTVVKLEIERDGEKMTVDVTRDIVTITSVTYEMLKNNIGYIRVDEFMGTTKDDYDKAVDDLTSQGMQAMILDFRLNGGGFVDVATDMLDEILPKGTLVYLLDKNGKRTDYTSDEAHKTDIPIVILVSEETASAAEIFTGAMMDYDKATVIGKQTFGKGIVQTIIPLTDGSALKVTTETYYTPKGNAIHGKGLTPDIEMDFDLVDENKKYSLENDNQVEKAIEVLTKEIAKVGKK